MMGSAKEWAALLGFDRDTDERTMAARTRVLARTLGYLEDHFSDPDGARPADGLVMELGQFLLLAEAMEAKGRSAKFRDLYDTVVQLHLNWEDADRASAFEAIARKIAVFKGVIAFSDAWLGTATQVPRTRPARGAVEPFRDDADVKTRIVRSGHL
jgi:hypothetical protein